mgnify:CR=1 FL=1
MGAEACAWWRAAGGELFDWQELVIDGILGLDESDRWASTDDGLDVARQNGKGVILQVVEGFCAFELGYPVVMHTAHEFATSQEHQLRLEAMIQEAPHLHARVKERGGYVHANGKESIRLKSGSRIIFKARTKGGGRGYSGDLLVWDEAMEIPDVVVGAQKPMLRASRARHGPKTIYAGSAVDQEVHQHGVNFARLRARGIAQAPRMSWHEWSAPFEDPDAIDEATLRDRSLWVQANPSMTSGLVSEEMMADEIEGMPSRTVAVELLGAGDWPATDGRTPSVIDLRIWGELVDRKSELLDPVVFAFDVSPDRRSASISVAGHRRDRRPHLEVIAGQAGTGWVVPRLIELCETHERSKLLCEGASPAKSLVPELAVAGIEVEVVNVSDYSAACGLIFDSVEQRRLRHLNQPELTSAIRGATTRPLGDAWAWSRKNSKVNITSLVSSTLALWGASAAPSKRRRWAPVAGAREEPVAA